MLERNIIFRNSHIINLNSLAIFSYFLKSASFEQLLNSRFRFGFTTEIDFVILVLMNDVCKKINFEIKIILLILNMFIVRYQSWKIISFITKR